MFRACCESNYAVAVLLLALIQTCGSFETHPPTLHCLIQGSASIGRRRSALSLVVSGPLGLRTRSPDQLWSLDHSVSGPWARARMPRPASTAFTCKDTHCLARFSFTGGQRTSCSRRTSALEAVLLSAIPVKRTAAASDLLCSFGGSCLGSS